MTAAITPRSMSFAEYAAYQDGAATRYELVEGELIAMTPPTFRHMLIAKFIEQCLDREIQRLGLGWLCFREAGLRTGLNKSRLTDVYVLTPEQVSNFLDRSAICQTAPKLAVEVVSPDSVIRDYRYKRSEYGAIEVPEYWIIDPIEAKITVLLFNEGLYEETVFVGDQQLVSATFPQLAITVSRVLGAGTVD